VLRKAVFFCIVKTNFNNEDGMPLKHGEEAKSKKGFSSNVKEEMKSGKGKKQSLAIAYSEAGEKKKPKKKGK